MAGSARIGSFAAVKNVYGVPIDVVSPVDNIVTPSTQQAADDLAKFQQSQIYESLQNLQREQTSPTQSYSDLLKLLGR